MAITAPSFDQKVAMGWVAGLESPGDGSTDPGQTAPFIALVTARFATTG
jgi:hypothetical protein